MGDDPVSLGHAARAALDPPTPAVTVVGCAGTFDYILGLPVLPTEDTPLVSVPDIPLTLHQPYFGGCAFNIVVAAASAGVPPTVISPAGDDFDQHGYGAHLQAWGVDTTGLVRLPDGPSSAAFLIYAADGSQYCIGYTYSPARLRAVSVDGLFPLVRRAAWVGVAPNPVPFVLQLARTGHAAGARLLLAGPSFDGAYTDQYRELVTLAEVVVLNRVEYAQLCRVCGCPSDHPTRLGPAAFIVTDGSQGSTVYTPDSREAVPPALPRRVVDPSGAGDAYAGGVLAGVACGYRIIEAARLGSVIASFVVEEVGCQTGLSNAAAVAARYAETFGRPLEREAADGDLAGRA